MTEYQIERLDFEESPDDMEIDELRDTLTEFKEQHDANAAVFDEVVASLPDEGEFDDLKAETAEFKQTLVAEVSEVSPLGEDDLANFTLTRLYELRAEFSVESDEADVEAESGDADEDEGESPSFTEEAKESRAGDFSADDMAERTEAAKEQLRGIPGLSFD